MNQNPLYPIFLKLHELQVLVVGAGEVGYEKMSFMLKSSPEANVTIVAPWAKAEVVELMAREQSKVNWKKRKFKASDIDGHDLIIAATNDRTLNEAVRNAAKESGKLVNVADTPELCDFYLGGIVTRGNLKVAISTNGKSPTFAKRFRQLLEATLPENVDALLLNLRAIRERLTGNFEYKVNKLNEITSSLLEEESQKL